MARRRGFIALAVAGAMVGVVMAALAARGDGAPSPNGNQTPPPPTTVTFDEGEWAIITPAGWTHDDVTRSADAKKAVRYSGPNGEYFIVAIDPLGSDYAYDALWTYVTEGKSFRIVAKQDCTGSEEQGCSINDDRFDGYVMWRTGSTPKKVGGHIFYFMFGNSKATTIDASVFVRIAESIRVA